MKASFWKPFALYYYYVMWANAHYFETVFCVSSLFLLYTLLVKMHVFKTKHEHCL